ncbi:MAG TPA: hypothetical protein VGW38_03505, partial [Chloroflexota bacterium]|nr:hypothetical protein [Chloroflexota bacterium]
SAFTLAFAIVAVSYLFGPGPGSGATTPAPAAGSGRADAARSLAPGEVAFEVDDATLTRQVNAALSGVTVEDTPLGSATVRDLSVRFLNGRFEANGTAQMGPTGLPVSLAGTVQARDGRPVVSLSDARIGTVPLPQSSRQAIEQLVQGQLDQLLANRPLRVRSVTLENGMLTIIGAPA